MRPEHVETMKARARNLALRVAYDGTNYHGFQRQSPPVVAVQNVLERALERVCGETVELAAAGRTDAGVHAYGQVVNFFTDGRIPAARLPRAVNGLLPPDIVVTAAWEAARDFSARHSAVGKAYLYRIERCAVPNPFSRSYAWQIFRPLDTDAMRAALALLEGTHDFSSLRCGWRRTGRVFPVISTGTGSSITWCATSSARSFMWDWDASHRSVFPKSLPRGIGGARVLRHRRADFICSAWIMRGMRRSERSGRLWSGRRRSGW